MDKKSLRVERLQYISSLSTSYLEETNKNISDLIINGSFFQEANMIFCFVSYRNEVETKTIIEVALSLNKRVCVPKCHPNGVMKAIEIISLSELEKNKMGIYEPVDETNEIRTNEIDFAIIPCVTCNYYGERLGYGGGYYDRFLIRDYQGKMIVVCREQVMIDNIPLDMYDQLIDYVCTENGIFERKIRQ